jgi:hypothetical protein
MTTLGDTMNNFKISLALAGFVNQRLDNQQARIQQGEASGSMTGKQAARDESHDANIAQREAVDESKHNGHITKPEQRRLNRSENRNSKRIAHQKHT